MRKAKLDDWIYLKRLSIQFGQIGRWVSGKLGFVHYLSVLNQGVAYLLEWWFQRLRPPSVRQMNECMLKQACSSHLRSVSHTSTISKQITTIISLFQTLAIICTYRGVMNNSSLLEEGRALSPTGERKNELIGITPLSTVRGRGTAWLQYAIKKISCFVWVYPQHAEAT